MSLPAITPGTATEAATQIRAALEDPQTYADLDGSPRAVFLIGSCSIDDIPESWWQDFDIHFLFDENPVHPSRLEWMQGFLSWSKALSTTDLKVDGVVRDRHWKMTPDAAFHHNIGMHATLLGSADHFRRVVHHPVLANNMYARCRSLYGDHPARIRGMRKASHDDYLVGVGGIAWLNENFNRAVAMHQLDPTDRSFAPFIGGYSWNVVGASLFHLYTLITGRIGGRHDALRYAIDQNAFSTIHERGLGLVEQARLDPLLRADDEIAVVNAAGAILDHISTLTYAVLKATPEAFGRLPHRHDAKPGEQPVDRTRDPAVPTWESIAAVLADLPVARQAVSFKEQPEFLLDSAEPGGPSTKVRIWCRHSMPRRLHSNDFAVGSATETVFGWETGAQAYLQRLNEWTIAGIDPSSLRTVAERMLESVSQRDPSVTDDALLGGSSDGSATARLAAYVSRHTDLAGE